MNIQPQEIEQTVHSVTARFLGTWCQVTAMQPASGGFSDAQVWKLQTASGDFALRSWRKGSWPLDRIRERHRWLRYLHQHQIPVAVPVPLQDGTDSVASHQGSHWQLEPWMPGSAVVPDEMSPARWRSIMSLLARVHHASKGYTSTLTGRAWFHAHEAPSPTLAERRRIISRWSPTSLIQGREALQTAPADFQAAGHEILAGFLRHAQQIDQELATLQHFPVPVFPCFRDLWREHVLFTGDSVTGLIDPTAARTDHVSADLSRLLGSLLPLSTADWDVPLQIYANVFPLAREERELIRILDRSSILLSGMTWIERWQDQSIPAAQLPQVIQRLQQLVARLPQLSEPL